MLIAHVSVSIALEPSSHNQKPLSDYYTLSKRNFDMAPWLLTKKDNLTDYDRLLAFELLEVTIGNEDHAISNILHGFLRTAYASNGEYLPYATDLAPSTALLDYHRAGNIGGIYSNWRKGQNYRKQFENDYPWIESLLGSGTLAARMPGISKWSVPITVSIGLPNNLLPQGIKAGEAGSSVFMPINKNDDPRKEDLIFSTVDLPPII